MKSKLLFFIIITFLVGTKWVYNYIYSANVAKENKLNIQKNSSSFDSIHEWKIYRSKMLQNISNTKIWINNLKSIIKKEDKIVLEKLEKQIECLEFKNNQLELLLNNYNLETVTKFQFFKLNLNAQIKENKQLKSDLTEKHRTILKQK
jgi:hypothetical protein